MNIPYSNKKHFNNSYHHPQQQQQDENLLGMSYQASSVHPMNFNNSFKQFKNEQQYGTPVSDSGSNFASSFSSNTSSSFSSASSLALSNLGSSFSSSALSTSTIGSPPNFYYGSSPNPQPTNINGSLNNNSYSKTNLFTPTITSSNTNNENNLNINSFSTPKSGASQTRPIVHSRPMSWDDVGEYARQSYSTSSSSNSGGLFMNELSSSMDDLTLASSPGLFGGSQFGSSLSTSYANSFNEAKIDNITSSNPIDNMFVRSVVDKVLSDENNQDDEAEQLHSSFKPRPTSQFHNRATSMDRYLHPQQAFKNTATPVNRRTLSQSCPTGMAQMNGVGYQLFQQQQQQNQQKAISPNNIQQDDSAQPCRFYYSPEGCPAGENCPFMHSNTAMIASQNSQTRVHPQQQQPQVSKPKSRYQNDTFTVINFGSSSIPHSPSLSQQTPPSNGVLPIVNDNSANANISNSNNSNQATPQVCQFFKKGECKFGDKCRNVHLKNKSKIDEQSRKKLKSIRCRFGVNCPFGHECYYYHTDSDFEDTPSNGNNEEQ